MLAVSAQKSSYKLRITNYELRIINFVKTLDLLNNEQMQKIRNS